MKKVFYIKDSIENKISYYHILFFMLALPFDRFYSTIILISFLIHTLIFFRREQFRQITTATLILQSVFFVTLISLSYAIYIARGLEVAVKQLAIFLFPLLLAVTRLDLKKYREQLLFAFALGCTLTVLYLFFDAFHIIWYNRLPLKSLLSRAFVNQNFSLPLEMHATYLSMLLVVAVTWLMQQLTTHKTINKRVLFASCLVILLAGMIQLGSKSILIAFIIIINAGFPWLVVKKKNRSRFLLISLSVFALLITSLLSVDVFRNRYLTLLEEDLHENTGIADKSGRLDRWNAAIHLIKQSPVAGTGSGSEIPLLRELYFERKMYAAYLDSLNVHNQYLGCLINTGIIGLLVYLATLGWGLWQSIKKQNIMLLAFMVLVMIVSFSEDLLDVNKGIFFYSFFFSFFILCQTKKNQKYISYRRQPAGRIDELYYKKDSLIY